MLAKAITKHSNRGTAAGRKSLEAKYIADESSRQNLKILACLELPIESAIRGPAYAPEGSDSQDGRR